MGGKAKAPPSPPAAAAPVRADAAQGEQALIAAGRRKGLASTRSPNALGAQTALGSAAGLGAVAPPAMQPNPVMPVAPVKTMKAKY
jgi:hypothetical protein